MKKIARHDMLALGPLLVINACMTATGDSSLRQAEPVTVQNAAGDAFDAFNSAFLVQKSGQTYYASALASVTSTPQGEWQQALDIYVAEDAYQFTRSDVDRNRVIALLNSLEFYNSPGSLYGNWQTDGWDDNLAWMVNAFLRGYELTGIPDYLTEAAAGWNNAYNQGWDTTVAGGGVWENTDRQSKCALSNDPFVFEGVQLYLATQDASYLTKAESIYAWVRTNLANTTSGNNNLGPPGQVNGCVGSDGALQSLSDNVYDSGSFVKAAGDLYRITGNAIYYDDAVLAIDHIMGEGPVAHNNGEAGHQWAYWFTRGVSDFATEANLWPKYQSWLQNNADAAWSERSGTNITWNDWTNPTDNSGAEPNEMSSAAAIWQHLPPPHMDLSGVWEIQNAGSGLALNVSGASTANGAPVIQYAFTSGSTNALWTFVPTSGGYYQIQNVNSGQVLNVQGGSGINGAPIIQWPPQGPIPGNDQWRPVQNADGTYSFFNLNSLQALDDPGESTNSGAQMDQWFGNGTSAQKWNLIPGGTATSGYKPCPAVGTCAIMPLGDSVTAGFNSTTGGGYRLELLTRLQAANHAATVVGDNASGPATLNGLPFPQGNEGFSGYDIDNDPSAGRSGIAPLVPPALARYSPDVILLMIGTNDVGTRNDLANLPMRLSNLADVILSGSPHALLIVAQILPLGGPTDTADNSLAQSYNAAIVDLVNARASAGQHIATVDMYAAMTANASYDTALMNGLHPNDNGYAIVGDAWYAGLAPYL